VETPGMAIELDRRQALAAGLAAVTAGLLSGRDVLAATPHYAEALARVLDGREAVSGGITIDAPEVAEDGNMVAVSIRVESPMTEADHVRRIVLLSTRNPVAEVATFQLTPRSGEAFVANRIRLSESQDIVAIAELSDGTLRQARREVRVTIGGCGAV
jgi:sulfur-oxidizing protein SoxY